VGSRVRADSASSLSMIDRQLEHPRLVAWMRRSSARSGLNVDTAMPGTRPDRPA
jgi:hypothetical protein